MKNFIRRLFWLFIFVYLGVSLFDLVSIRYQQRKLNTQIGKLRAEEKILEDRWQYLLLEKSRIASSVNYDVKVHRGLNLHEPDRADIIYLPSPK